MGWTAWARARASPHRFSSRMFIFSNNNLHFNRANVQLIQYISEIPISKWPMRRDGIIFCVHEIVLQINWTIRNNNNSQKNHFFLINRYSTRGGIIEYISNIHTAQSTYSQLIESTDTLHTTWKMINSMRWPRINCNLIVLFCVVQTMAPQLQSFSTQPVLLLLVCLLQVGFGCLYLFFFLASLCCLNTPRIWLSDMKQWNKF